MRAPTAEEQRWIDFQNTWEGVDLSNPANAAALSVQYQRLCGNPDCASAISLQFLLLYGLGPFTGGPFRPNTPTIPRPPRQTISLPKDYYPPGRALSAGIALPPNPTHRTTRRTPRAARADGAAGITCQSRSKGARQALEPRLDRKDKSREFA